MYLWDSGEEFSSCFESFEILDVWIKEKQHKDQSENILKVTSFSNQYFKGLYF